VILKINILGTSYVVKIDSELEKINADGECKPYLKLIRIRPVESMCYDEATIEEKHERFKEVMRHELIHAFFSESGLDDYSSNEQLVDWLAAQFPKLYKAFVKAGCSD
jgi:hypothetical protein